MTIKTTNKYSVISVINYDTWQNHSIKNDQQNDQQATSKRPASDHIQEYKEYKEEKHKRSPRRSKSEKPESPHKKFISWWCFAHEQVFGVKYHFTPKDGVLVSGLMETFGNGQFSKLVIAACNLLTTDDEWMKDKQTIGVLHAKVNDLTKSMDKIDDWRELGIVPPEGVRFDEWNFDN